jgi:YHS domain-containing protein
MKPTSISTGALLFAIVLCISVIPASCTKELTPVNVDVEGLAIKGYDTVAYFTVGKPVKGNKKYEVTWNGAKWRFSTEDNAELFRAAPEKYAPKYGGY